MRPGATFRALPELPLAALGFVFNFLWEYVQCPPFFAGMDGSSHLRMCLQATVGDVGILLVAFWATALVRRDRGWIGDPRVWEFATFVALGVVVAVVYELAATRMLGRWSYSEAMPALYGVGVAPIAQWLVIPPIVAWVVRWRVSPAIAAPLAVVILHPSLAFAAPPANLDELVSLAVSRDPSAYASSLDQDAARARASGARQPISPQLMLGVDSLGAPMDDPDPTMWMAGVSHMLPGWGQLRAQSRRFRVDADRAGAERERVAADLRLRLWQSSARLEAFAAEKALLDEQIGEAETLKSVAFARYRNVPASSVPGRAPVSGSGEAEAMPPTSSAPPRVDGSKAAAGGMTGMGGGGGATTTSRVQPPVGDMGSGAMDAGMGSGMGTTGMGSDGTLPGLLRLEVTVERLRAERATLEARLDGEVAVLALYVGDEAAGEVAARPTAFRGAPPTSIPERKLAEIDRAGAEADLALARARRRPDVMWSVAARVMPVDGELAGVNASVGIALPIWGGLARQVDAGRREVRAAEAREAAVDRDLAAAVVSARASLDAARVRREALETHVLPSAEASYVASRKVYASGRGSIDDALLSWETLILVKREQVAARRDVELRTAELARVETR